MPLESRLAVACLLFLWVWSLGSAFFESLPYTATIAAVLKNMAYATTPIGIPLTPLGWALSVGACVGGIGSIMGSSANLVALAVSHRYSPDEAIEGRHFLRYGLPLLFILTSVASLWQVPSTPSHFFTPYTFPRLYFLPLHRPDPHGLALAVGHVLCPRDAGHRQQQHRLTPPPLSNCH